MAVHAHPDDEAISTGGVLARYADEGIETVLVTCTDGAAGDGAGGVKPGEPGHDPVEVAARRRAELEKSCAVLGVTHLEMLGFHDSGMAGWSGNDASDAFWQADPAEAAPPLVALMRRHRPQVVVTYDERGFYGHPDHIQAHRITVAAIEATDIPDKLYYPALPRGAAAELDAQLRPHGLELPQLVGELAVPDESVTTVVDCSAVAGRKYASLAAHASQAENIFFLRMGEETFVEVFRREAFIRARDRTGAPVPETDLFAGLR